MHSTHGLILPRQSWLAALGALYIIALLISHATLPKQHVWAIAALFSIIMNGVYIHSALKNRRFVTTETTIATLLVVLSGLGVILSPVYVIAAIALHGAWDLAKHFGAGLPFFSWYTWGCATVDFTYAAALTIYLFR